MEIVSVVTFGFSYCYGPVFCNDCLLIVSSRYGQMERVVLSSEIAGLDLRGVTFSHFVGVHGVELSETVEGWKSPSHKSF